MCSVCLVPREGEAEALNPVLERALPLFVLAMTITLRPLQGTNAGCLPCLGGYIHPRGSQKAECKRPDWSPAVSCLRKC